MITLHCKNWNAHQTPPVQQLTLPRGLTPGETVKLTIDTNTDPSRVKIQRMGKYPEPKWLFYLQTRELPTFHLNKTGEPVYYLTMSHLFPVTSPSFFNLLLLCPEMSTIETTTGSYLFTKDGPISLDNP
jgi:hypothetical protein